jgi:DNA/RNA-binding domain of Phe-tRNA-synthetase-like protein
MEYRIAQNVAEIGVKVIFATINGVDNTGRSPEWNVERTARLANLCKHYKNLDVHEDSILEGYNILHDKAGVKRRKNVPSSENLIKMLLKHQDIPFINQVVDIYNVISMESRLCVAAHNLDKVEGNLTVRFSDGTETYLPLGAKKPVPMKAHEYCYCDDSNEVLCRLEIRQVEKTKVDERVRNILYIIEGNEATDDKLLFEVMQEIVDTTMKYCGGVGEIFGETVYER